MSTKHGKAAKRFHVQWFSCKNFYNDNFHRVARSDNNAVFPLKFLSMDQTHILDLTLFFRGLRVRVSVEFNKRLLPIPTLSTANIRPHNHVYKFFFMVLRLELLDRECWVHEYRQGIIILFRLLVFYDWEMVLINISCPDIHIPCDINAD